MSGVIGPDKPLTVVDVTVGTKIVVYSARDNKEKGRFTITRLPYKDMGRWKLKAVLTNAPGCAELDFDACFLGLIQNDCEHSRYDPKIAYFDPTP